MERIVEGSKLYSWAEQLKKGEKLFEKRIITKEQRRGNYILSTLNNSRHGGREREREREILVSNTIA